MKTLFLPISICASVLGCVDETTEKTRQMITETQLLETVCTYKSEDIKKKFTGSASTISIECNNNDYDINSAQNQNKMLVLGWTEKKKSNQSTVFCLRETGISLLAITRKNGTSEMIMRYPSSSCDSAFSIYKLK